MADKCPDADWSQYGGAIIARRKSNSSNRYVSVSLPAGHPARVGQVSGKCPTGGPTTIRRPTKAPRQVCDRRVRQILGRFPTGVCASVRQESGVRQELFNRCPAPLRQVPGRCPTGVSDRWPTGVRRPTATVKQVSDRHGCQIGINICPTGVQVPTGVRQACLTSGRHVSERRLDSDKWPTSVRTPI